MMYSIPYPSGGVKVNGLLMTAAGREPSPLVVLLHGFPGTERNLDVAQALRMAVCHVAFFHYRGAWGSPGTFSFSHVLEDPCPDVAVEYRIDSVIIFVVGHSMGGFAALLTGAARDDLRGVAGIAPYDFGKAYLAAMADPSGAQAYEQVMGQPLPELKLETPDVLLKDLEAHAQQWCFDNQIDRLAGKNVLVFGFDRDDASTMEMHILPFIEKAPGPLRGSGIFMQTLLLKNICSIKWLRKSRPPGAAFLLKDTVATHPPVDPCTAGGHRYL